ncbi:SAM-dependent methyltransferase [Tsukamurella soli]|uniref:SAM-dependent methyltransferase n=1 Tax=Tsukamurella soli TaxID=644556 RepID=A0ABP8K9P0_9ACTN
MSGNDSERSGPLPLGIDLEVPSAARIRDYFLGGSHNFGVDRAAARRVIASWPDIVVTMQQSRAFQRRVVRHLVDSGVRQFLELRSGIPTAGSVHEQVQALAPDSAVVYVDPDPITVAQSAEFLRGDPRTAAALADACDIEAIFGSAPVRELIDPSRPVGVLMLGVLHFVSDDDRALAAVSDVRARVAEGSAIAIWHGATIDGRPELADSGPTFEQTYGQAGSPYTLRSREQVQEMFRGWELLAPGVVELPLWRPDDPVAAAELVRRASGFVGVARKGR